MMLSAVGLVLLGLVLLVAGGEVLLRGAVGTAILFRLTPAVIALTVVAAGTSVPELAVSMIAVARGSTDIGVANAVGSNIFNIAFILGFSALITPLAVSGNTVKLEYPVLALVTALSFVVCRDGLIDRFDGALFVAIYVCFTTYVVRLVRKQMKEKERTEFEGEVTNLTTTPKPGVCAGLIIVGIALLGVGAQLTVSGAVTIAISLGISERIVGLTIVAGGTGLPEVVTSLVSSYRGRDDVAIGNVIGSNIFNILCILGLTALITPLPVEPGIIHSDNWWLLGVTLLLFPLIFTGRKISFTYRNSSRGFF